MYLLPYNIAHAGTLTVSFHFFRRCLELQPHLSLKQVVLNPVWTKQILVHVCGFERRMSQRRFGVFFFGRSCCILPKYTIWKHDSQLSFTILTKLFYGKATFNLLIVYFRKLLS